MATHLHGHTLDLVLTTTDGSGISNVRVAEFISDHALVLAQLDSVNPSQNTYVITFRGHHKIDMDSLRKDLGNCSFVRRPGGTVSVLCEQYLGNLNKLLLTPTGWQKPSGDYWNVSGVKINWPTI